MALKRQLMIHTFLLTLILPNVKSQTSFPSLTDNATWSVYGTDNFWSGAFFTRNYEYEKDTLFCGRQYIKIQNTPNHPNNIIGYARVDNEKVYIRTSNNCADREYLMYDFSLNIGDTVYCGYDIYDTTQFWVVAIDTVNYYGIDRKKLRMNFYMGTPPWGIVVGMDWIEGIGSTTHPFYPTVCLTDNCETLYTLLCYDSSGTQLYQNPSFSTCDPANIGIKETTNKLNISVYPNPFMQATTIEIGLVTFEKAKIEIYMIDGKKLYDLKTSSENMKFQIGDELTEGIYILKLLTDNQEITKKIIKIE